MKLNVLTIPWNIGLMGLGGRWQIACVNKFWIEIKLLHGQGKHSFFECKQSYYCWLILALITCACDACMEKNCSHFNVKVEMQIILLMWFFKPSCSKRVWLKGKQPQGAFILMLMGPPFSKVVTLEWHLNWRKNILFTALLLNYLFMVAKVENLL